MEPQLFSCGLVWWCWPQWSDLPPSMEPQLFSCGLRAWTVARTIDNPPFNGAATFQLRIVSEKCKINWNFNVLQWSRNFSVADCLKLNAVCQKHKIPSMEPQLFSCGLLINWLVSLWWFSPFNGAATFQLRIENKIVKIFLTQPTLQWSRNFSVADCRKYRNVYVYHIVAFNGAATFQLRIATHVITTVLLSTPFNGAATFQLRIEDNVRAWTLSLNNPSMEPQLFSCGLATILQR